MVRRPYATISFISEAVLWVLGLSDHLDAFSHCRDDIAKFFGTQESERLLARGLTDIAQLIACPWAPIRRLFETARPLSPDRERE